MEIREVLVSLDHDRGTAGVIALADEPGLWLTRSIGGYPGGLVGYRGLTIGLGERTLQGGRVPDHTSTAEVIAPGGKRVAATVGRGAYVVIFDGAAHEPLPVRFADGRGELVPVPVSSTLPRKLIPDAVDPCPVCDEVAWEDVGVCGACGHEEQLGVDLQPGGPGRKMPDSSPATRDWPEPPSIDFTVYGLAGRDPAWAGGGWGGRPGYVDHQSVKLRYAERAILVETSHHVEVRESTRKRARQAIEHHRSAGDWPDLRDEAHSLWLRERDREHTRATAAGEVGHETIAVEGRPVEFTIVTLPGSWAACADLDEYTSIVISAVGVSIETIEFVAVDDLPEPPEVVPR